MNPRRTLISLCAAAATVALGASAASSSGDRSALRYAAVAASTTADVPTQTSSNWAGYAVTGSGTSATPTTFTSVSGSWVQPAATCTAGSQTYSAFWVGLGGFADGSQALEQTGTESDCSVRGKPTYSVWYELVPAAPVTVNLKVLPGDAISATVGVSGQTVSIQISNTTRGTSFTKQLQMNAPDVSSAEWIAEAPSACGSYGGCRPLPLTNFGTVSFTGASVTGDGHVGTIGDPAWTATSVSLQGVSGGRFRGRFGSPQPVASAIPGALSSDGSSFSVSWSQQTPTAGGGPGAYPYPGWGGYGRGWGR